MTLYSPYVFIPLLSILLLLGGYAARTRNWGPFVMLAGAFGILGSLFYHVSRAIG